MQKQDGNICANPYQNFLKFGTIRGLEIYELSGLCLK